MEMKEILIKVMYPDCDSVPLQEFKEVVEEYFAANIMDGDLSRLKVSVVDVTGKYSLLTRLKKAREEEKYKLVFSELSEGNKLDYKEAVARRKKLEAMASEITPDSELLEEVFNILSNLEEVNEKV